MTILLPLDQNHVRLSSDRSVINLSLIIMGHRRIYIDLTKHYLKIFLAQHLNIFGGYYGIKAVIDLCFYPRVNPAYRVLKSKGRAGLWLRVILWRPDGEPPPFLIARMRTVETAISIIMAISRSGDQRDPMISVNYVIIQSSAKPESDIKSFCRRVGD